MVCSWKKTRWKINADLSSKLKKNPSITLDKIIVEDY